MPKLRTSLARGFAAVTSTPSVLVAIPSWSSCVEWLVVVLLGFQGPFELLSTCYAIPLGAESVHRPHARRSAASARAGFLALLFSCRGRARGTDRVRRRRPLWRRCGPARCRPWTPLRILPVCRWRVNSRRLRPPDRRADFSGPFAGPGLRSSSDRRHGGRRVPARFAAGDRRRRGPQAGRRARPVSPCRQDARLAATSPWPRSTRLRTLALVLAPAKPGSLIGVNPRSPAWAIAIGSNLLHVVDGRDARVPLPRPWPRRCRMPAPPGAARPRRASSAHRRW